MRPTVFDKPILHLTLIVVLGLLAYSNTFDAPFHLDDYRNIVDNPFITSLSNIPAMFSGLKGE